jgi:thiamine kinase-like enzyme
MATTFVVRSESAASDIGVLLQSVCGWSGELLIAPISGGITNLLFKVSRVADPGLSVLVRVFGPGTEIFIDRRKDNANAEALSKLEFGPHFYGSFENGRVEQYFNGAVPLTPSEMQQCGRTGEPDYVALIAAELGRLHELKVDGPREPSMWNSLTSFHDLARGLRFNSASSDESERNKAARFAAIDFALVADHLGWLQRELGATASATAAAGPADVCTAGQPETVSAYSNERMEARRIAGSVVFSHNDLLSANILRVPSGASGIDNLRVIDCES